MTIDLAKLFDKDAIVREREKRTPPTYEIVRLNGGPLDNQIKRLERAERIVTFTTDAGAVQYIRRKSNNAYCEYDHLTPELQQQIEFDEGLRKVSMLLENSSVTVRWVARFGYNPKLIDKVRDAGFRWDVKHREWFQIGSRDALASQLNEIEGLPGVKVTCEPVQSE